MVFYKAISAGCAGGGPCSEAARRWSTFWQFQLKIAYFQQLKRSLFVVAESIYFALFTAGFLLGGYNGVIVFVFSFFHVFDSRGKLKPSSSFSSKEKTQSLLFMIHDQKSIFNAAHSLCLLQEDTPAD